MTSSEHISPNPFDDLAELRAALGQLGALLDRDDISDDVYQKANTEYDTVFDRVCQAEDNVIAAPISSDADVIAKLRVLTQRLRLGSDVVESLKRLQHQLEQYATSNRTSWIFTSRVRGVVVAGHVSMAGHDFGS